MDGISDPIDQALLDEWQRDFPVEPRPFDPIAAALGVTPDEVIARLKRFAASGRVTRVGATCAPNTVAASTLAAVAAPDARIRDVARIIGGFAGVNHAYLREHDWNLWFVVTGPDRAHVNRTLAEIEARCGLTVLDLRLLRPFNVDLGFAMRGATPPPRHTGPVRTELFEEADRPILQALTTGLPLTERPFRDLAGDLGLSEDHLLDRIGILSAARIIARLGVIVRHRALGWRANAMVVWDMSQAAITHAGPLLAAQPGVTLCYERRPVPGIWPYRLYSMIHARSRPEAISVLDRVCALPEFADIPHVPLFSVQCFKQMGALVDTPRKGAA